MRHVVIVTVARDGLVVFRRQGDRTETSAASARTVGFPLTVQHQVPQGDPLAEAAQRPQENVPEIVDEATVEGIVPGADGRFGEVNVLVGEGVMDLVQRGNMAPVVVPGASGNILRRLRIFQDMERIVPLGGDVVIVVIVVEQQYLGLDTCRTERRAQRLLDEVPLVLPGHVQGHGIPPVQRFILQGHGMDGIAPLLHFPNPAHKIVGVILIIHRIQPAARPAVIGGAALFIDFHPLGTAPGRGDDLHRRIDLENLVQDREQPFLVQRMHGEVFHPRFIAPGELVHREIGPADAYPDQRGTQAFLPAEQFRQEGGPVRFLHQQQVVTAGLGDGQTESVHLLERLTAALHLVEMHVLRFLQGDRTLVEPLARHGSGVHGGDGAVGHRRDGRFRIDIGFLAATGKEGCCKGENQREHFHRPVSVIIQP